MTRNERDLTRGRANTLRLAISGQLGPDALRSDEMAQTMALCVGCKACKRECPTGVDMARMKIEYLHQRQRRHSLRPRERLVAALPRYAPLMARLAPLLNLRNRMPALARLGEGLLGLSARRSLPLWRRDFFRDEGRARPETTDVLLLVDTFNRYFAPEIVHGARRVLAQGGRRVGIARAPEGGRPLCCGRTLLATGLVEQAREEARRTVAALHPFAEAGVAIVGLEPSCLLSLRDEYAVLLAGPETEAVAGQALLFEEYLARAAKRGEAPGFRPIAAKHALLHGHCHQKAFGAFAAVQAALRLVPELEVEVVASSCCGMAGAFGYEAEHYEISLAMGELSLLPKVRAAAPDSLIVASGTSCRHQILDGTGREALHVATVLERALVD